MRGSEIERRQRLSISRPKFQLLPRVIPFSDRERDVEGTIDSLISQLSRRSETKSDQGKVRESEKGDYDREETLNGQEGLQVKYEEFVEQNWS